MSHPSLRDDAHARVQFKDNYGQPPDAESRYDWIDHDMNVIRRAGPGRFRIVWEDHKYYEDDEGICEYTTLIEAIECADAHDIEHAWYFVYDDKGALVYAPKGKQPYWPKA